MEHARIPPFERRVIQRSAQGIGIVQDAVHRDDPAVVIGGFETGFSANMCEEFPTHIESTGPTGIAFGFAFSPEWPGPELGEMKVGPQHVEMSKVAAKRMREQPTSTLLAVVGRVIRLQNEADPTDLLDERHEREIVVHWKSDEYGDMNVKMSLMPNDYLAAVNAHMHGRAIRVSGKLEKRRRQYPLSSIFPVARYCPMSRVSCAGLKPVVFPI